MGRNRIPDTVCVMQNKTTGQLFCAEPTSQPSYLADKNLRLLGRLTDLNDAREYMQFRRLETTCDKIAYLMIEHEIRDNPLAYRGVDMSVLEEMCRSEQSSSGRTCFGHCHSLDESSPCSVCYFDIPNTWRLCATVDALRSALANTEYELDSPDGIRKEQVPQKDSARQ